MKRFIFKLIILAAVLLLLFRGGLSILEKPWLLEGNTLEKLNLIEKNQVQEVNGKLVAYYSEHQIKYVPMERIPAKLKEAFVAIEDSRFYFHGAVDPIGLARAVVVNLQSGKYSEGGSTITQQLAKNLFLSPEKTLKRKLLEVALAFELEKKYSKNDILEMYMNQIYLDHKTYGIENASQEFFGKSVRNLNLAEMAMLAGVTKNPARYSPRHSMKEAKARQKIVLNKMVDCGYITEAEAKAAYEVQILPR